MIKMINKKRKNNKSGFSLIEMLISMAIFSILIVTMSGSFGSFIKGYKSGRDVQIALEDSQQVLNSMAKKIRTSSVADPISGTEASSQYVRVFEYSQSDSANKCVEYYFEPVGAVKYLKVASAAAADFAACKGIAQSSLRAGGVKLINSPIIDGGFNVLATNSDTEIVGRVTIYANIQEGKTIENSVPIQTTVSLRDYVPESLSVVNTNTCASPIPHTLECPGTGVINSPTTYSLKSSVAACSSDQTNKCEEYCAAGYQYNAAGSCDPIAFDYTLTPAPASISVSKGFVKSSDVKITVEGNGSGIPEKVTISTGTLPSGITVGGGQSSQTQECTLASAGGTCLVTFTLFYSGTVSSVPTINFTGSIATGTPKTAPVNYIVYACGSVPSNSTSCSGTGNNLTGSRNYDVVGSCNSDQTNRCEATCNSGFTASGGTCVANGACGSSNGGSFANSASILNKCNAGTASATTINSAFPGGFTWNCVGSTTANCSASYNGTCDANGWAWGGGATLPAGDTSLGWIKLNGGSLYGIKIPAQDGSALSGYAWSENLGWVSFNSSDLGGCPSGTCSAVRSGNNIVGWARILSANSGGWLGWVKLDGGALYGVTLTNGVLGGKAWSDELGWIYFSGATIPWSNSVSCVIN
jgi:prepilin-type N-terminal cleavage/methylation domain-containing protein